MSRCADPGRRAADALSRGPGEARRILGVEQAARRLLLGGVMPLWLGAGLADWYLHRRTHIERTAGPRESAIHSLMFAETGVPVLLGLYCEVNATVLLRRVASTDWAAGVPAGTPWQAAPETGAVGLTVRAYEEDEPGDRVGEQLAATWPAFHRWWREGANTRPTTGQARARLEQHMPELVPTWEQLTTMIPGSRDAGAALALWNPPPFLTGCSQAAVLHGGPALIRNYDWDYRLFDGVVAKTAYTGRRVLGMLDCLWGLLDGVNDAGLAVSLTFGGRPEVGEGFGIPLVMRYVLEVCRTADEAVHVLRRVPVHMSYNVTALDRSGRWATVYLAPDRPPRVTDRVVATNHQGSMEWAPYATAIRSVEREQRLEELLAHGADAPGVIEACLRPPLYATRFHHGFGTLYTAEYRPADGIARYHWPQRSWEQSLSNIKPDSIQLQLGTP